MKSLGGTPRGEQRIKPSLPVHWARSTLRCMAWDQSAEALLKLGPD